MPKNLRHLILFDLEVADDQSWHVEFAMGVTRLRRNKLWPTLIDPLVRAGLYKLAHETDRFISIARRVRRLVQLMIVTAEIKGRSYGALGDG